MANNSKVFSTVINPHTAMILIKAHIKTPMQTIFNAPVLVRCPIGKAVGNYTPPSTVTTVGNSAFYKCDGLTGVTIPDSVTAFDSYAFDECDGLTAVTVPAGVTSVADYVFGDCTNLRTVTILTKSPGVGSSAFNNSPVETVNYAGSEDEWNASD